MNPCEDVLFEDTPYGEQDDRDEMRAEMDLVTLEGSKDSLDAGIEIEYVIKLNKEGRPPTIYCRFHADFSCSAMYRGTSCGDQDLERLL